MGKDLPRQANPADQAPERPAEKTDYNLLIDSLTKRIIDGSDTEEVKDILAREETWRGLDPESALQWAYLCQMAGLSELSLKVLEWITRSSPGFERAWRERIELAGLLERREELAKVRAEAISLLGEEKGRALAGLTHALPGEASPGAEEGHTDEQSGEDEIGDPFLEMRREEEAIRRYMTLFQGREDVFARQWYDEETDAAGYVPVRRPLQPDDVRDHLQGKRTYGIYLLNDWNEVHVGVIDVDLVQQYRDRRLEADERDKVRREEEYLLQRLVEISAGAGMPCITEFTGGKGYHLWYPLDEPVEAGTMRAALRSIAVQVEGDVEAYKLEVFPKQDRLTGKGLGNLVKLPLGIHRGTGKPSFFLMAPDRSTDAQLAFLAQVPRIPAEAVAGAAARALEARVLVHPRHEAWVQDYPELAVLQDRCAVLAQILARCRRSRTLSIKEEKILLGTVGHLPNARKLLHHVFEQLPEYNRPLLDYKISRIRGTPLGCKRIHRLIGDVESSPPCRFDGVDSPYWNPLLHIDGGEAYATAPKSEKVENLEDALESLVLSIRQVQRYLRSGKR